MRGIFRSAFIVGASLLISLSASAQVQIDPGTNEYVAPGTVEEISEIMDDDIYPDERYPLAVFVGENTYILWDTDKGLDLEYYEYEPGLNNVLRLTEKEGIYSLKLPSKDEPGMRILFHSEGSTLHGGMIWCPVSSSVGGLYLLEKPLAYLAMHVGTIEKSYGDRTALLFMVKGDPEQDGLNGNEKDLGTFLYPYSALRAMMDYIS